MSVYTEVTADDLRPLLQQYQAGDLLALAGIRDGIENTNYFVTTTTGDYVLTLFEHTTEAEIEFALGCMSHFAHQGLPCAEPLADQQGRFLSHLHHKPASLVTRLNGQSVHQPTTENCRAVGRTLAQMHLAGQTIKQPQANPRGEVWRQTMAEQIRHWLDDEQLALLDDELRHQQQAFAELPHGIIHADLFRDNVLFVGSELSGLIDLYNAGHDLLLYDLAITVNDWCTSPDGDFDKQWLNALLQAYTKLRPITPEEQHCWPTLLRRAALRFWLSRLYSVHFPREGQLTQQKDPAIYLQLLLNYRQNPPKWPT